jgi:hypothetical protein
VILLIGTEPPLISGLPRNEEFSKALYTIDIGQNDLAIGLQNTSEEQVKRSIPDILSQFSQAVQVILDLRIGQFGDWFDSDYIAV